MRLCIANASPIWGGAERIAAMLAGELSARGHAVLVLAHPRGALRGRLEGGVECRAVLRGFDLNPLAQARGAAALRRHRTEVVLTTTDRDPRLVGLPARALGVPLVHSQATDRPVGRGWRHRFFQGMLPTHWVVNSEATRATYLGSAPWIPPERVTTIHNGIDADSWAGARSADLGLPEGALAIGYVGRLDRRKGLLDLASAWPRIARELPAAHLVIAGEGELEAELRRALAGAERVRWLGFVEEVAGVYRALDCVVVPSLHEGFGLAAAEAMAAGAAVVATRASSLPEVVGEAGLLVEPAAPEQLAEAVVRLGRDAALRARLAQAGSRRVRELFSLKGMMDRFEELLAGVAKGSPGRADRPRAP